MDDIKYTTSRTPKIGRRLLGKVLNDINNCKSCNYCQYPKVLDSPKILIKNPYLFVSDGPEESEDATRVPFTSPSGRMALSIISSFLPPEKYWVCYTVFCSPLLSDGTVIAPSHIDTLRCSHNLIDLVELLQPRQIIALGKIASKTLKDIGFPHVPLAHPLSILKNGGPNSLTGIRFSLQLKRIIEQHG